MNNHFSKNLKRIREAKGFTQDELAQATGLKRITITGYETERRECDFDTLILLSNVFLLNFLTHLLRARKESKNGRANLCEHYRERTHKAENHKRRVL